MPLRRVLEPEVMDTDDEARDYDAMDHREVNQRFVDDFLAAADDLWQTGDDDEVAATILDVGTGTAQIPLELCRRTDRVHVVAIDLAVAMLELAKLKVEIAGQRERIYLDKLDAKRMPYEAGRFSAVMSNSIVHHIPEPSQVLSEIVRVTAPGGLIFVRDLMRPAEEHEVHELVEQYAADANDHQRAMFEASLRAALSLDETRALIAQLGMSPAAVQATSDRHWTWVSRKQAAS